MSNYQMKIKKVVSIIFENVSKKVKHLRKTKVPNPRSSPSEKGGRSFPVGRERYLTGT